MLLKWETALGIKGSQEPEGLTINLGTTRVVFIKDQDGRGDGPSAFEVKVKDPASVIAKAEELGLLDQGEISI